MGSGSSVGSSLGISPVKRLGSVGIGSGQASLTSSLSMSSSSVGPRMSSLPGMTATSTANNPTHPAPHIYGSTLSFPSLDSAGHSDSEASNESEFNYSYVILIYFFCFDFLLLVMSNDILVSFLFSSCSYRVDAEQCEPRSTFSELEAAVRRLTPAEVALRRAHLGSGTLFSYDNDCRTPDSIMSTGSSGAFSGNSNSMNWKLPDKLQVCFYF